MPKGPKLTKEVERLIATVYKENDDWPAKQIGAEVNRRLRSKNPDVPSNWPGLSSVQKYLTKIRQKKANLPEDPKDRPWSVITLAEYNIPPEALPIVLDIYFNNLENHRAPLTIRQVKWIARLFHVVKDMELLEFFSWMYAKNEDVNELLGEVYLDESTDSFLYHKMKGQTVYFAYPGEDNSTFITSEYPREYDLWKQSSKQEAESPLLEKESAEFPIGKNKATISKHETLIRIKDGIYARPYNKKVQK